MFWPGATSTMRGQREEPQPYGVSCELAMEAELVFGDVTVGVDD